jgi:hypothetical protein
VLLEIMDGGSGGWGSKRRKRWEDRDKYPVWDLGPNELEGVRGQADGVGVELKKYCTMSLNACVTLGKSPLDLQG